MNLYMETKKDIACWPYCDDEKKMEASSSSSSYEENKNWKLSNTILAGVMSNGNDDDSENGTDSEEGNYESLSSQAQLSHHHDSSSSSHHHKKGEKKGHHHHHSMPSNYTGKSIEDNLFNTIRFHFNTLVRSHTHDVTYNDFPIDLIEASCPQDLLVLQEAAFNQYSAKMKKEGKKFKEVFNQDKHPKKADLVRKIELTLTSNFPQQLLVEMKSVLRTSSGVGKPYVFKVIPAGFLADPDCKSLGPKTITLYTKEYSPEHLRFLDIYSGQTTENFISDYTRSSLGNKGPVQVRLDSVIIYMHNIDPINANKIIESSNVKVDGKDTDYRVMSREDFDKYSGRAADTLREAFNFSNVTGKDFAITFTPIMNSTLQQAFQLQLKKQDSKSTMTSEEKKLIEANCKPSFKNFFTCFPTVSPDAPAFSSSYGVTTATSPLANIGAALDTNGQTVKQTKENGFTVKQSDMFDSIRLMFSGTCYIEYMQSKQLTIANEK